MVFMMVFLNEWGSRRGRRQNGDARQETGRHLGDPNSKSGLRNGLRSGLQRQTMGSRGDGRSHVRGSGRMRPQMNRGCRGQGGWRGPVQHAHAPWAAIGDGLIDFGDRQRCFIAKLQASRVGVVVWCAVVAFRNRHILWCRPDRQGVVVDPLVQETRVGHPRTHCKQPHRQDQPGGMAQRTAVNGHVGGTINENSSRLNLRAQAALTQIKHVDAETDHDQSSVRRSTSVVGSSPHRVVCSRASFGGLHQ